MHHIRTEPSDVNNHRFLFEHAHIPRHFEKLQCIFQRDVLEELTLAERSKLRFAFLTIFRVLSHLHVSTKSSKLRIDLQTILGMNTQLAALVGNGRTFYFLRLRNNLVERLVELVGHLMPFQPSARDLVELLLDLGSERIIQDLFKMLYEEIVHDHRHVGREQLVLLGTCDLVLRTTTHLIVFERQDLVGTVGSFATLFNNIASLLYGRDRRRVGRRAADAQFFEFLYQAG